MKNKIIILITVSIFLLGIVIAQGWTLPSTFTINPNFAGLPTPQPNQTIFGCVYAFPIEIRDVNLYAYSLQGQNLNLNASFSLYTNNKRSACSVKQRVFTIQLTNWQNNLEDYIVSQSSNNISTNNNNNNNPISIGKGG